MSPVEFKKRLWRPVEFKGRGPHWSLSSPRVSLGHPLAGERANVIDIMDESRGGCYKDWGRTGQGPGYVGYERPEVNLTVGFYRVRSA